ncbi:hypothetical protein NL676_011360 [Syzygium grande]|nr:hypothetical protein NL676_011360 [Syzygium grande]
MEENRCGKLPVVVAFFLVGFICSFGFHPATAKTVLEHEQTALSTYIVHVRKPAGEVFAGPEDLQSWYQSFLSQTTANSDQMQRMVHSYKNAITGFAAKLTADEAKELVKLDAVVMILGSSAQNYSRTVMNVGPADSSYTCKVDAPEGVDVTVYPSEIKFSMAVQMATYTVGFSRSSSGSVTKPFAQESLTWVSSDHSVRSPIAVVFK